jgi:hypothetical protein
MLQTAENLNEFQYETLLLASGIMQRYGGNTTFSRRHLESLKIQLQENLQIYFTSTKLERNGRNYYFISLDRPRHPNPRHQANYNNDRLLRPRAHRLKPNTHHIIERLCRERHEADNVQPLPALFDENEVNDNEQALVLVEDVDKREGNDEQQANIPMIEEIEERHVNGHQNYILIDAIESDNEEEVDSEEGGENLLTPEEELVNYALTLHVEGTAARGLRPSRDGEGTIELSNKKQLDSHGQLLIVVFAVNSMGYNNPQNSKATKKAIALAAQSARMGRKKVLASNHKGRQMSYVNTIDAIDPTYLKQLYRYATTLHGDTATYSDLANAMNAKANTENVLPDEMKPTHLSVGQLKRWFKEKKGKSLADTSKPYLTEEQQQARVTYCRRIQELMQRRAKILYFDEK